MLLPLFQWLENLPFSVFIRESTLIGPMVNAVHVVALILLIGAILMVDLRLLGTGLKQQPLAVVAKQARPWFLGAFAVMFATGIPQLTSTAMKQYYSEFFWWKMQILLVALLFTFTVRHWVTMADESRIHPLWARLVGVVSILLWFGVAIEGRLIGLLS